MRPETFDELEHLELSHWWFKGMREITAKLIPLDILQRSNPSVLDAGCGVGGSLKALACLECGVGVDYSFYALRYAAHYHPGRLYHASIEALPFSNNCFDLVVSFDVVSNAGVKDELQALQEFMRVIKPGGYLLLRLPAMARLYGTHDIYIENARRYDAEPLKILLMEAGLTPIRLTYANTLLLPLILAIRKVQLVKLHLTASRPHSDITPVPAPLNQVLHRLLKLEAYWIGSGHSFPAGVSLYALAQKSS
jgi:SAM-dependent methyltransferase